MRLFCFHHAGGGASVYRSWQARMSPDVEVYPVQTPGRENRFNEALRTDLDSLAESIAVALLPYQDRPFAFFGHSLGALVAFETARRLRRSGLSTPAHLYVAAHKAPHIPRKGRLLHRLADDEFLSVICDLGGMPECVLIDRDLLDLTLPALKADFAMYETYRYVHDAPLDCDITAFGGLDDPSASWDDLEAWEAQTTGAFAIHGLPGGHFFTATSSAELTRLIRDSLSEHVTLP